MYTLFFTHATHSTEAPAAFLTRMARVRETISRYCGVAVAASMPIDDRTEYQRHDVYKNEVIAANYMIAIIDYPSLRVNHEIFLRRKVVKRPLKMFLSSRTPIVAYDVEMNSPVEVCVYEDDKALYEYCHSWLWEQALAP